MGKQDDCFMAERLKEIIHQAGLSYAAFSRNSGIPLASVQSYVNGRSSPSLDAIIKIADYFALPMDYLLGRCDEEIAKAIEKDYSSNFMKLRRESYEAMLPRGDKRIGGYEAPWPYNLLDDILNYFSDDSWDSIIEDEQMEGLNAAIDTLNERSKRILLRYYRDGKCIDDIGKEENVTRERIRQINSKSVRILRHPSRYNLIKYGPKVMKEMSDFQKRKKELESAMAELDELEKDVERRKAKLEEEDRLYPKYDMSEEEILDKSGKTSIDDMDLSVRSYNCLKRVGCYTLESIVKLIESGNITGVRNLGIRSLDEILDRVYTFTGIRYDKHGNVLNK